MRVGRAVSFADRPADGVLLHAVASETSPGVYDCAVVDGDGNVYARLEGYETIALPAPIPDDVAADLHAAYRT